MIEEKKFIPEWKIYSPSDLSKNWFIYYHKDGKRAKRVYGNINTQKCFNSRMQAAVKLIQEKIKLANTVPNKGLADKMYSYLEERKPIYRKKTYDTYKSKIKVFVEWLGNRPLHEDEIKTFFSHILEKKSSYYL